MKNSYIAGIFFCLFASTILAQNVGIGGSSFTPSTKAMLEIQSTTSGVLIPRMTAAQKTAIAPGAGLNKSLLIYQTDGSTGFYFWDGSTWVQLTTGTNWSILGNAGTVDGTNFLGTTDNIALNFDVNNHTAGRVSADDLSGNDLGVAFLGNSAGEGNTNTQSTGIGHEVLRSGNSGNNTAMGNSALYSNTTGSDNLAIGIWALTCANTNRNIAIGDYSLQGCLYNPGSDNVGIGRWTMAYNGGQQNVTVGNNTMAQSLTASFNVVIGYGSHSVCNNLNYETVVGWSAGPSAANGNTGSVYIGSKAGYNCGGNTTNNVFLGREADASVTGLQNAIAIGYQAKTAISNSLILGGTGANAVMVAIGTTTPTSKLQVVGLPLYANNAAAVAGGLTVGAFYRTGADPDPVCVVH